ncbi:MAG: cytochrome-c oxidase, cbb3-type subunit III [Burkholderiaceae bacterium]|nr:cytochrome-c oxidase, cbb3-type subunit III [Burkholderiaceae bacterium]
MSSFWSWWVIVLIVLNLGISFFLFLWGPRAKIPTLADGTTGHVWAHGVLREGMHPLPRWWIVISFAMFLGAFGYLVLYPGFGNSPGRLGWTAHGELARDTAANDQLLDPTLQRFAALSVEQLAGDPQAVAMGQVLFGDNCEACHGRNARGNRLLGAPNLADSDWLYGGDGKSILTSILDGRQGVMPPWGEVFDKAGVENLTNYVLSLSLRPHDADSIIKASEGKKLFTACAACHGADGKGNQALGAPNLTDNIWLYGGSPATVEATIRDGRSGHMPEWRTRLGDNASRVIAAYVYSLSHSGPPAD